MRTFTFHRPITLVFSLSLLLIIAMCVYGLTIEFRLMLLVMLLVTSGITALLFYFGFLRRMQVGSDVLRWITPGNRFEWPVSEVRHYGIVKFRRFRFVYVSRAEQMPFSGEGEGVVSNADTFLIQYRPQAWELLQKVVKALHPQLEPQSITRD